jgi:four helix bundle protein
MRFDALELAIQLIRHLRPLVERLRSKNADAARQIRRAADSVANNLAEGRKRLGRDRVHHWSIAAGSADEVRTALRVAVAWGDLGETEVREALQVLDRLLAICWRLTH